MGFPGIDPDRRNKHPRLLTEPEKERLDEFAESIHYSSRSGARTASPSSFVDMDRRYSDNDFEYRHVQLPKEMLKKIPKDYFDTSRSTLKLLWEDEWRGLGITQVRAYGRSPFQLNGSDHSTDRVLDGNITRFMSRSHTSFFSSQYDSFPANLVQDLRRLYSDVLSIISPP